MAGQSKILLALGAAAIAVGAFAWAGAGAPVKEANGLGPAITEARKGTQCVNDTEFMRKNHMKVLDHQRDETVLQGIRTKRYSLKQCIDCHASEKTGSVAASKDDFCVSCHSYAAVKIDCFDCHSTKPQGSTTMHPLDAETAHYKHKLAAGAKQPVSVDEMARVAE